MIGGNYMAKTITFKDGADLDRIDALLSGTRLVDGGVDNLQSELFTNNSEEWEVITRENDRLKEKLKAYEPIIDKLAEVRQGVFQIKQEDEGWVLLIRKAHPLSDDIG